MGRIGLGRAGRRDDAHVRISRRHANIGMGIARDELMTVDQLLDELGGVSRRTFFRWREIGRAPQCIKLPNGELRIWRSELMIWLRGHSEHVA